jgi:DNA-binding transcriptional MerR regulator
MADRAHLSIGEVLGLLQQEFPDVTISKIRFLESQGLIDPERTPSGYRKFYEPDVARLRWILRQQRENFLPLKVIKERLADTPAGQVPADAPGEGRTSNAAGATGSTPAKASGTRRKAPTPALFTDPAAAEPAPRPASSSAALAGNRKALLDAGPSAVSMTVDELSAATGLPPAAIAELERYGLLAGKPVGPDLLYDEDALVAARLAAAFRMFGVEARHLRMYRTAAEREATFFEQVVMPMLKQRNPAARRQAFEALTELADLGEGLRAAMLRQALRGYAGQR